MLGGHGTRPRPGLRTPLAALLAVLLVPQGALGAALAVDYHPPASSTGGQGTAGASVVRAPGPAEAWIHDYAWEPLRGGVDLTGGYDPRFPAVLLDHPDETRRELGGLQVGQVMTSFRLEATATSTDPLLFRMELMPGDGWFLHADRDPGTPLPGSAFPTAWTLSFLDPDRIEVTLASSCGGPSPTFDLLATGDRSEGAYTVAGELERGDIDRPASPDRRNDLLIVEAWAAPTVDCTYTAAFDVDLSVVHEDYDPESGPRLTCDGLAVDLNTPMAYDDKEFTILLGAERARWQGGETLPVLATDAVKDDDSTLPVQDDVDDVTRTLYGNDILRPYVQALRGTAGEVKGFVFSDAVKDGAGVEMVAVLHKVYTDVHEARDTLCGQARPMGL